jgi:hypothetical protein
MKAIETRYKGYRFRSRLGARWAVFFDVLGVTWEYEPEGFELGGGVCYLPDFRITSIVDNDTATHLIEIKGAAPSPPEIRKLASVCRGLQCMGAVLYGTPGEHGIVRTFPKIPHRIDGLDAANRHIDFQVWAWRGYPDDRRANFTLTCEAIAAARGARFEFGESGARA